MIQDIAAPSFKPSDFDPAGRKPGLSAIVRLRNEEEFAEQALNSILPFFDEVVVVFNGCSDRTPEIVGRFADSDPQRVKAFHYLPEVFPQGSEQHRVLPPNHVSSLVHYYNFALSRSSYRVCTKWDGDMVAAPEALGRVVARLRALKPRALSWWGSPWFWGYWWFCGVNLWDQDGDVFVPKVLPRSGARKDIGFWPAGRAHIFRHHSRVEYLRIRWFVQRYAGFVYYHLRGLKSDRGLGVYQLDRYPYSPYREMVARFWTDPELITFEEFVQMQPGARDLPHPESLGIRPAHWR